MAITESVAELCSPRAAAVALGRQGAGGGPGTPSVVAASAVGVRRLGLETRARAAARAFSLCCARRQIDFIMSRALLGKDL